MDDVFERYGLRRIINVSGTETPYGASRVRQEVIDAVRSLVGHAVYIDDLQDAASRTIARILRCEAGCITGCTAASISMTVAGCMTGTDVGRVEQLPDATGMRDEVVVQKGHVVDYGHNVTQNIRLAGARAVEIGAATECRPHQLRHALSARTAAALFVVSHLTVQHRMIDLATFADTCRTAGVPTIVDAASVTDPRPYLEAGADLVLFSTHKAFASLTAGVVAGRKDLVDACRAQASGIGRPMKVGKEGIIGAIVALEAWHADPRADIDAQTASRLQRFRDRMAEVRGVRASFQGRTQVRLDIDARAAAMSARDLSARLRALDPALLAWDLHADSGTLLFTLSRVSDEEAASVARAVEDALGPA